MNTSVFFLIAIIIFVFIVSLCLCIRASKNQKSRRNQNNSSHQTLTNRMPMNQTPMNRTPTNQTPMNQTLTNHSLIGHSNQVDSYPHYTNMSIANNMLIGSQSRRTLIRSVDNNGENSPPPSYDAVMGII